MKRNQSLIKTNGNSRYQAIGSEGFIRSSLEEFWRNKEEPGAPLDNFYSGSKPTGFVTYMICAIAGMLIGSILKISFDLFDGFSMLTCFAGIIASIPIHKFRVRLWERKNLTIEETKKSKYLEEQISKYESGNDFDRAEMILDWIDDESFGLLVHLRRQMESARGDASGYAKNEKAKHESAIQGLERLLHQAENGGKSNRIDEIEDMLDKANLRLKGIDHSPEVIALQTKLQQAENKVSTVEGIVQVLKNEVPFDRDMEKYRLMYGQDEGYQSVNSKSVAHKSLLTAMTKLEEVISTSENLEDNITEELPNANFPPALKASPVQKVLNEA